MKAVVAAFNQEKALVGAFSVITNFRMDLRFKLWDIPRWSDCVSSSQTQHRRGQGWGFIWNISQAGSWCQETQVKFPSDTHSGLRSFTVLASLLSPLQSVTRRNRSSVLQFWHRTYNIHTMCLLMPSLWDTAYFLLFCFSTNTFTLSDLLKMI